MFNLGSPSARIYSHITIALVRSVGRHPCRYVSGYLFHKGGDETRSTQSATHAWVEAFLPGLGWTGFDPTNNIRAGERPANTRCVQGRRRERTDRRGPGHAIRIRRRHPKSSSRPRTGRRCCESQWRTTVARRRSSSNNNWSDLGVLVSRPSRQCRRSCSLSPKLLLHSLRTSYTFESKKPVLGPPQPSGVRFARRLFLLLDVVTYLAVPMPIH